MNFNEKLIELRKSKGLSQDELGQRLGYPDRPFQNGSWLKPILNQQSMMMFSKQRGQ